MWWDHRAAYFPAPSLFFFFFLFSPLLSPADRGRVMHYAFWTGALAKRCTLMLLDHADRRAKTCGTRRRRDQPAYLTYLGR